jgi:DNA-binding NarL/FixJ family response regulator
LGFIFFITQTFYLHINFSYKSYKNILIIKMCKLSIPAKLDINKGTLERLQILIIDDDPLIRSNIRKIIKGIINKFNLEFDIIEGCDGNDTINLVMDDTENLIRIIFTDENMAEVEGSEAISEIRDIKESNAIKIVSITSLEDEGSVMKILKSGADKVLTKPASKVVIEEILRGYLM